MVRNQGHQGHHDLKGRALSASHINPSAQFAEISCLNSVIKKVKACDISVKTTSNGGCKGQEAGAGLLKQLQVKILAKKLADQNDREVSAGRGKNGGGAEKDCESCYFVKAGREGLVSKDGNSKEERQPNRRGGLKGCPEIFCEHSNSMEKLRENNVEVFRKAFGVCLFLTEEA